MREHDKSSGHCENNNASFHTSLPFDNGRVM